MYDVVCVGFGPAQLAIAIALRESRKSLKVLYLERKTSFSSQPTEHISRTRMENPFVYDLATIRNPRSAFTYVNYLLARKRLIEFANSDRLNPLREEFEDYLRWCAAQFKDQVKYGNEAVKVTAEKEQDVVRAWNITFRDSDSKMHVVRARHVIAPFPSSHAPDTPPTLSSIDFLAGQRIISMDEYTTRRNELRGTHEPRLNITVVGSGGQTAEILDDLLSCSRLGNITLVTEDELFAPLRVFGGHQSPAPTLCSIWAKPSGDKKESLTEGSELVQTMYMRAYEKQVVSKGQCGLRVVSNANVSEETAKSNFIIRDNGIRPLSVTELLQDLDALALGCRSAGDSLDEIHFKRGSVEKGCKVFLMSARSNGGRSLAKDIATTAGKVARSLVSLDDTKQEGSLLQARI